MAKIKGATVEREVVLHCAQCKTRIDEFQDQRYAGVNAIIYITGNWEVRAKEKGFWLRPTDVPNYQYILCYVCANDLWKRVSK